MKPEPYATLIARGWDTIQEAWPIALKQSAITRFDQLQSEAREQGNVRQARSAFDLSGPDGPWRVAMRATGAAGGVRYVFGDDQVLILARLGNFSHPISVRYLSLGLWTVGHEVLQAKVRDYLEPITERLGGGVVVTSRADYAFDWHAPAFTAEAATINPKQACVMRHNGVGADYWRDDDMDDVDRKADPDGFAFHRRAATQTITMGRLASGSQVQLYSKSAEVNAAPSKRWFREIWAQSLPSLTDADMDHVWRVECRVGSGYLKEHALRGTDALSRVPGLIPTMLQSRRLCVPVEGRRRDRWPTHPLWEQTIKAVSLPEPHRLGRVVTGDYDDVFRRMVLALAGYARAAVVLADGAYTSEGFDALMAHVQGVIEDDPGHARKIDAAMDRYRLLEPLQ